MIKKFEEFINERYNSSLEDVVETRERMISFFDKLGFPRGFMNRFGQSSSNEYSFEELANIVDRLNVDTSSKDDAKVLSYLFDLGSENDIERKQKSLDYFSENRNNGIPVPVVVDINGKLLTGEVYYCEALDAFAKEEDDFNEEGYDWLAVKAEDEGILDDDQPDWMDDHWDWLDIYPVNLDEEYLDKEQDSWVKRK
jgi:hypothetical protein